MRPITIQTSVDDKEIEALKNVADLSTIRFGEANTKGPDCLNNLMLYKLEKSIYRNLNNIESSDGLSNDLLKNEWSCLTNKYLYNFGGGTISYLKALKSMEDSLEKCNNEEVELVVQLLKEIGETKTMCYISLGCGNGEKDNSIIKKVSFSSYFPIDINSNLIKIAYKEVLRDNSMLTLGGYNGDFTNLPVDLFSTNNNYSFNNTPKVYLCLGHTIGNYQESKILKSLSDIMNDSDYAIISFEKQRVESANRYKSSENTDFLLNPFRAIDDFGFVRHRYVKRSKVTGLSEFDSQVQSYLFTLGTPNGSILSPIHIIWTNRYEKEQVQSYFNQSDLFDLKEIVEKDFNIVVLLKRKLKEEDQNKIMFEKCNTILNKWKQDEFMEKKANALSWYLNNCQDDEQYYSTIDKIIKYENNLAEAATEMNSICKKIKRIKKNRKKKTNKF